MAVMSCQTWCGVLVSRGGFWLSQDGEAAKWVRTTPPKNPRPLRRTLYHLGKQRPEAPYLIVARVLDPCTKVPKYQSTKVPRYVPRWQDLSSPRMSYSIPFACELSLVLPHLQSSFLEFPSHMVFVCSSSSSVLTLVSHSIPTLPKRPSKATYSRTWAFEAFSPEHGAQHTSSGLSSRHRVGKKLWCRKNTQNAVIETRRNHCGIS